jgi:hypothetical protein
MNAAGFSGYDVADDGTGGGAIKDLHTVNFSNYDVVVVASDYGGWLRQAELDILNARSSAIISFINGGGGLVAFAESGGASGSQTTHNRFGFLPFVVSSTPLSQSETANTLTPFGTSLGLVNNDINGNFSHNVFTKTGPLQIVDVDPTNEILSAAERGLVVPSVDTSLTATSGQSGTSITVPIGSSVVDAATLMGATPDAGGTVGFVVYSDSGCTTAIASGGSVTVVNGSVPPSNPVAFNTFGTFYWVAGYSGDPKNIANASACGGETVTVVRATPSVSTTPSGSVPVGGSISDSATLTGGFSPSGSVTFQLFAPGDTTCAGPPISTTSGTLTGGTASSGSVTVGTAGTYNWVASYAGDANNNAATSSCGTEPVVVTKASPSISTTPSGSVPAGGVVSDSATISGGVSPAGTVTFQLFAPVDTTCSGQPISTSSGTLTGGTASSDNVTVGAAGTYNWVATYNGDANNNSATSPCGSEPVVVTKATPSIATTPSGSVPAGGNVSDSATVTGGLSPTGIVTFELFAPADTTCAGPPISTTNGTLTGGTASSGNGAAGGVGTYNWVATYGGDATNNSVMSPCGSETVEVTKATPSIATTPSGAVPAGGNASDSATLTGGFSPGGSVVFTLYAPGDTTCKTPIATKTGTLTGGTASSGNVTVGAGGTYNWVAAYGGDPNNNSVTSPCGSEPVNVTAQRLTGRAFGLSANATAVLGTVLVNVQPIPDTGFISTTSSSTTSTPCVTTLSGLVSADVLCANVTTVGFPGKSTASASVADARVGIVGIPTITMRAVKSTSTTTCGGSAGTTTIDFLQVGSTVVIAVPTQVAPNTTINVGVVKLVLNEQVPFSTPDKGLTVNAVHATVNAAGVAKVDVIVASSKSDIGNCP